MSSKINLFSYDPAQWETFFAERGEKRFRVDQIMKWIYHRGVLEFNAMNDLSKTLRTRLEDEAEFLLPSIAAEHLASDGTRKWAFQYGENAIESVFIPEDDRGTLCISSQAGCALACPFCSTAQAGFNRNLSAGEIVAQVWLAKHILGEFNDNAVRQISNVVLMGMGEPLLNFDAVMAAVKVLMDDRGFGLSKRRVTISTSGVVPAIRRLASETDLALAVSLHAPDNALRDQIVPINRKYPLEELIPACRDYVLQHHLHGGITWEYVMLRDVNDSLAQARALAHLLRDVPSKINLIPFNPFPQAVFAPSPLAKIFEFKDYLEQQGFVVTLRKTRGQDIDAACGQLVGSIRDRSRRHSKRFYSEVIS